MAGLLKKDQQRASAIAVLDILHARLEACNAMGRHLTLQWDFCGECAQALKLLLK